MFGFFQRIRQFNSGLRAEDVSHLVPRGEAMDNLHRMQNRAAMLHAQAKLEENRARVYLLETVLRRLEASVYGENRVPLPEGISLDQVEKLLPMIRAALPGYGRLVDHWLGKVRDAQHWQEVLGGPSRTAAE